MATKRQQWEGTKTPSGGRMEKITSGEPKLSRGPVLLWGMNEQCMIMIQGSLYVRSQTGLEQSEYYTVPSGLRSESSH